MRLLRDCTPTAWARGAVAVVYLGASAIATYVALGLNERYANWVATSSVAVPLLMLHVVVGALINRWWAALLPLGWIAVTVPAGGWPLPAWGAVAVQTVVLWAPAILVGVALRRLARRSARSGLAAALGVALVASLAGGLLIVAQAALAPSNDLRPARFGKLDEERGTYGGVGIDSRLDAVLAVHGRDSRVGPNQLIAPRDAAQAGYLDVGWTGASSSAWWYCYDDVCFWLRASPERSPAKATVGGLILASPGAATRRGVQVGDALDEAHEAYPELACRTESFGESIIGGYRICTGRVARDRWIWFGGDPIDVILVSATSLDQGVAR